MIRRIVTAVFLTLSALAFEVALAQDTIILDGFTGVPQVNQVQLRWVINAGQTCNGISIERSADTLNWEIIGDIPGICGSSSSPVPYNFIDEMPLTNAINFYRLELGGQGYSTFIGIPYYNYSELGYVLIPNPANQTTTLYFGTSESEEYTVSIFTINGMRLQQTSGNGSSRKLDVSGLSSGVYLFVISRPGKKNVSGKLIVR